MKELEITFIGKGEVKGFRFTQIKKNQKGYIYKVDTGNGIHYEVFKRHINKRFNCVSYPKSASFGIWAWSCKDENSALLKFESL